VPAQHTNTLQEISLFLLNRAPAFFQTKKISHELAVRSPGRGGVAAAVVEDEGARRAAGLMGMPMTFSLMAARQRRIAGNSVDLLEAAIVDGAYLNRAEKMARFSCFVWTTN
jgi:hypothetical protein